MEDYATGLLENPTEVSSKTWVLLFTRLISHNSGWDTADKIKEHIDFSAWKYFPYYTGGSSFEKDLLISNGCVPLGWMTIAESVFFAYNNPDSSDDLITGILKHGFSTSINYVLSRFEFSFDKIVSILHNSKFLHAVECNQREFLILDETIVDMVNVYDEDGPDRIQIGEIYLRIFNGHSSPDVKFISEEISRRKKKSARDN